MRTTITAALLLLSIVGCCTQDPSPTTAPSVAANPPTTRPGSWTGIAGSRMAGPYLDGPDIYVGFSDDHRWPAEAEGKRVIVTGTAVERHDLPVFIPTGANDLRQGIAVPPGTDLYKAGARTVIENPKWSLAPAGQ